MVYGGGVNKRIVAMLQSKSCNALGLTGADTNLIRSIKRPLRNGIDYGWVGDPVSVNEKLLISLLSVSCVPVIAPLTHDGNGHILNTNADTISRFIAGSLVDEYQVELIYAFELNGVLETIDKSDSVIPKIDKSNYEKLKTKGVISDGMIPKLDNAFAAIESGVGRVSIMRYDKIDQINQSEHVCTVIV
jgi:acetylglutamate kinase